MAAVSAEVVMRAIDRTGAAFNSVDRRLRALNQVATFATRSIGALGAAFGVRELAQAADRYKILENRLKLVTDSAEELASVQQDLFTLAQDTRSALEPTVELYSRMARATEELGLGQAKTIELTKAINQALQVSGATSEEASAGVIQFAQGLASGALRGDELRSVLEQMPRLARALADGMGITIGQLREAGAAGELTSATIIRAIQSQAATLQTEFDKTEGTVGQAVTGLGNSMLMLVGKIDDATGSSNLLSEALNYVSSRLDLISESGTEARIRGIQTQLALLETQAAQFGVDDPEKLNIIAKVLGGEKDLRDLQAAIAALRQELFYLENPLKEIEVNVKKIDLRKLAGEFNVSDILGDLPGKRIELPEIGNVEEAEAARQARLREALAIELESVRQHTLSRAEVEREAIDRRHEVLEQAHEQGLIGTQRFYELAAEVTRRGEEELTRIAQREGDQRVRLHQRIGFQTASAITQALTSLTSINASESEKQFKIHQKAAIANAIVATAEGVTRALGSAPPPLNFALAAAVAAAGAAEIDAIRSASFSAGGARGGVQGGGGSASAGATPPALSQLSSPDREEREPTVIVNFHGLTGVEINDRTAMLIGDALNRVIKERRYEIRGN